MRHQKTSVPNSLFSLSIKVCVGIVALLCSAPANAQLPDAEAFHNVFAERTVKVNGVPLHYVMGGHGSPIVLLHGFPETWYAWRNVMPALAENHTVIAPDLPGVGTDEKPQDGYDTASMAEDMHALVIQLGYRRIDLIAHDVGVAVAYAYAANHRDEVMHLALFDVPPQGTAAFHTLSAKAWAFDFQKQPELPEDLVRGREKLYLVEGFYKPLAHRFDAFTPEDIEEYVRAYQVPGTMHAAFEWYRHFDEDIAENIPQLKTKLPMPVLMMGGADSGGPLMQATADEIATNGKAVVIQDCGHWLMDEEPQEVLHQLVLFLKDK